MSTIRNQRLMSFLKKTKEKFLRSFRLSDVILMIAVIVMIFFKFSSESKIIVPQRFPAGDFDVAPSSNHSQSLDEIQDLLMR